MSLIATNAFGESQYYGNIAADSPTLKEDLHTILTSAHIRNPTGPDTLVKKCPATQCFKYKPESYNGARKHLFGSLHLEGHSHDTYSLYTYYCPRLITNADLNPKTPLAPMRIPDSIQVNTEHVWPQSKFSKKFPESEQKPNLHILLPVDSKVNSLRSNYPMGNVVDVKKQACAEARLGRNAQGETVFEPSDTVKGDVARALFYFSVRFELPIDKNQETALREWHDFDPPDEFEIWRNDAIFAVQKDRNPFIDRPEMVEQIADF